MVDKSQAQNEVRSDAISEGASLPTGPPGAPAGINEIDDERQGSFSA